MDMCLLCLELQHESVDCIYVSSQQWQENNMNELIEQHFWPLDSIKTNSWICAACFHILNEFHKFYIRIEEAHVDFAMSMKTIKTSPAQPVPPEQNDFEELIDKNTRSIDIVIKLNENIDDSQPIQCRENIKGDKLYAQEQSNLQESLSPAKPNSKCFLTHVNNSSLNLPTDSNIYEYQENELSVQEELNSLLEDSFHENPHTLMNDIRSEDLDARTAVFEAEQHQQLIELLGDEILDSLSKDFLINEMQKDLEQDGQQCIEKRKNEEGQHLQNTAIFFKESLTESQSINGNKLNDLNNQEDNVIDDVPNVVSHVFACSEENSENAISKHQNSPQNFKENSENTLSNNEQTHNDSINKYTDEQKADLNDNQDNAGTSKVIMNAEESPFDEEPISDDNGMDLYNDNTIDEEPITYDDTAPRKRKDPLERNMFRKIPKILIKLDASDEAKSSKETEENEALKEYPQNDEENDTNQLETNANDIPKSDEVKDQEKKDSESKSDTKTPRLRRSLRKLSNVSTSSNECSTTTTSSSSSSYQISPSENENTNSLDGINDIPMEATPGKDAISDSQNDTEPSAVNSGEELPELTRKEYDNFLAKNFRMYCDICKEETKTFSDLRRHFQTVHNEQAYVWCCDKKFRRRCHLVEHIRSHTDVYSYKCKYCERVMSTRRCLRLHEKHVHEKEYNRHTCDICGKAFVSASVLKKHKLIHLSEEEKKFSCNECGKKYGSQTLLDHHVRLIHLEKYVKICDICGMVLRKNDAFERHMLKHSDKPINYMRCDVCGARFVNEKILKSHMALKHPEGGIVEYTCHVCGKVSLNMRSHRRHVQYNHEMTSKYECHLCPKRFKQRTALKEHLAHHSQTPLYTCTYCPMQFISSGNMHAHRKNAHPLEWLEDRRAKYSGKLPPNHIPPSTLPRDESDTTYDS
ncbi:myoneurin isoform X2 [Musca domestica]|uniref:Myoneurin isoform X2 n=1 Tax=Musca domestica TaxID=7370 RepID=A0ABM3UR82_MUSDO|nr:myoneurin isoform X2 [Musca domestica]